MLTGAVSCTLEQSVAGLNKLLQALASLKKLLHPYASFDKRDGNPKSYGKFGLTYGKFE